MGEKLGPDPEEWGDKKVEEVIDRAARGARGEIKDEEPRKGEKLFPEEGKRKGAMLCVGGEWFRIRGKAVGTPNSGWTVESANGEVLNVALDDPNVEAEANDYGIVSEANREGW
jgi:hypothetical protein